MQDYYSRIYATLCKKDLKLSIYSPILEDSTNLFSIVRQLT